MQDDEAVGRLPRGRKPVKRKPTETLRVACGLQRRAAAVGFDWPDTRGPRAKVEEELKELDRETRKGKRETWEEEVGDLLFAVVNLARKLEINPRAARSEEHTSELQSQSNLVCRLLLEKKNKMILSMSSIL